MIESLLGQIQTWSEYTKYSLDEEPKYTAVSGNDYTEEGYLKLKEMVSTLKNNTYVLDILSIKPYKIEIFPIKKQTLYEFKQCTIVEEDKKSEFTEEDYITELPVLEQFETRVEIRMRDDAEAAAQLAERLNNREDVENVDNIILLMEVLRLLEIENPENPLIDTIYDRISQLAFIQFNAIDNTDELIELNDGYLILVNDEENSVFMTNIYEDLLAYIREKLKSSIEADVNNINDKMELVRLLEEKGEEELDIYVFDTYLETIIKKLTRMVNFELRNLQNIYQIYD